MILFSVIGLGPAHPRSRGENAAVLVLICCWSGSSPLTRGKRPRANQRTLRIRLIPAHAGKTAGYRTHEGASRAHPRSRGENQTRASHPSPVLGSSPLTRGKRRTRGREVGFDRLIPAHAGKTMPPTPPHQLQPAHPRSRGENPLSRVIRQGAAGSSPLTRGKRFLYQTYHRKERLIPAHAGKTRCRRRSTRGRWAHPRSRGENPRSATRSSGATGSSPLTRGKLRLVVGRHIVAGLIPAHAGKTAGGASGRAWRRAHPRSRGENLVAAVLTIPDTGSSPLTRGKRPTRAP